jgi:hypothetical protein
VPLQALQRRTAAGRDTRAKGLVVGSAGLLDRADLRLAWLLRDGATGAGQQQKSSQQS